MWGFLFVDLNITISAISCVRGDFIVFRKKRRVRSARAARLRGPGKSPSWERALAIERVETPRPSPSLGATADRSVREKLPSGADHRDREAPIRSTDEWRESISASAPSLPRIVTTRSASIRSSRRSIIDAAISRDSRAWLMKRKTGLGNFPTNQYHPAPPPPPPFTSSRVR